MLGLNVTAIVAMAPRIEKTSMGDVAKRRPSKGIGVPGPDMTEARSPVAGVRREGRSALAMPGGSADAWVPQETSFD
jgi:hypothetical protein